MPDRSRESIQLELAGARDDLANRLALLEHRVRETVDLKARARVAIQKGRQRVRDSAAEVRHVLEADPVRYMGLAAAVAVGLGLLFSLRARRHH